MPAIIPEVDFYEDLASRYEDAFAHDPGLLALVQKAVTLLPSKSSVLDAGCGTGKPVASTLSAAGHHVHGIDIAQAMVARCRAQVPRGEFEVADLATFVPRDNKTYDAVFAIFSLFRSSREEIEMVVARWAEWVPAGGLLFVATMPADEARSEHLEDAVWDADGGCARGVVYRFMGISQAMTLLTKEGWKGVLEGRGFEVVEKWVDWFVPPEEALCEEYPHYYVIARRRG